MSQRHAVGSAPGRVIDEFLLRITDLHRMLDATSHLSAALPSRKNAPGG